MNFSKLSIIFVALWSIGCGASAKEVRAAKTSGYKADFAVVYSEALAAVRELYPTLTESATTGQIKTAWHPVRIQQNADEPSRNPNRPLSQNSTGAQAQTTLAKRYFVRFDVRVVGGKPWRVRVYSQASSWKAGEVPVPLKGADVPSWLEPRTDAMRVAIHKRLTQYAVPLKYKKSSTKTAVVEKVDLGRYGDVPEAVQRAIHAVHGAAASRDVNALRALMADDFVWSLGSAPSADLAIATWQADPTVVSALVRALEAGCKSVEGAEEITCDGEPGFRAGFATRDGAWRLTSFVARD